MRGFDFSKFIPENINLGDFNQLLKLFLELLNYTAGDANEALAWLNELDKQHSQNRTNYKKICFRRNFWEIKKIGNWKSSK